MKHKVIYIGSDYAGETALRSILNGPLKEKIDVVGVITHTFPSAKNRVLSLAKGANIPLFEGDPNTEEGLKWVESLNPRYGIMLEYPKKLSKAFINKFEWILNAHPSDLPKLRGGAPIEGLILQQLPLVVSVHIVDEKFDHGDCVFKSEAVDVEGLHFYQVYELCAKHAAKALEQATLQFLEGNGSTLPQNEGEATYLWYRDLAEKFIIKWNDSDVFHIEKQIRAAGHKRGASTSLKIDGVQVCVQFLLGRALAFNHNEKPGRLMSTHEGILCVSAKGGYLFVDDYSSEKDIQKELLPKETLFVECVL